MHCLKSLSGRSAVRSFAAALALAAGLSVSLSSPVWGATPSSAVSETEAIHIADSLSAAFRNAAAKISPAVVNITTIEKPGNVASSPGGTPRQQIMPQIPEEFRRFFGEQGLSPFNLQPQQMPERRGQGSGVVIREDGYILTNNHVVSGADEITVTFDNAREFTATVVGTDPESDLAVIRIDATGLPTAHLGNSDDLQPGDWIVAVGNPFGLDHTVTAGVVSATGRGDMGINTFEDFIQTDAAINPGNSGGPMVNLHGEVVGINSAIRSSNGGSDGIGFAIPSNQALQIATSLIDNGRVERGWLGVAIQPLTPELASSLGAPDSRGALIADVQSDTPAAKAGIESGDIIVRVDKREITSSRDLINTIASHNPGEKVTLLVNRGGSTKNIEVKLGERPGQDQLALARSAPNTPAASPLGMQVQPMNAELATQLGVDETRGLVITSIEQDSPAAKAGLQPEDIILEADRNPVTSQAELDKLAAKSEDGLLLKINRAGRTLFVVVKQAN
ncbi:MAG: DegQ family serine endoprotease [Phycisphaerales bacterium]|nr:DegQ family serine endoprotease [Phycisphaerales bacterium]